MPDNEVADLAGGLPETVRHLLGTVLSAADASILITDPHLPDNPIIYHNPAFERVTGYAADEIDGRNCRFLQGPDTDPAAVADIRVALREERSCRVTLLNYRRDGTPFWNDLALSPVRDPEGRVTHFVGVQNDVTSRQENQNMVAALRESEERFRALTENSSDVTSVLAPDATILYRSPSSRAVLGYLPEELIGTNCLSLVHPDDLPDVLDALTRLVSRYGTDGQNGFIRLVYRYRHKDGSWRWLETMAGNQMENASIGGIVTNSRDVTERRRLEHQMIHSEKLAALGRLVAGVAHEINNPLAAISGHAQILRMQGDEAVRDEVKVIEEMVQRASRIIRSLRSYARTSDEDMWTEGDLNEAVMSALDVISYRLREADVELTLNLGGDLPRLRMTVGGIEQVIVNLLANAEQALRERPVGQRLLWITTAHDRKDGEDREKAKACTLVVQDSGAGIAAAVLPQIFDPFFTTKEQGEGTGLGLYICHGIITAHGGTIAAESHEGKGTTFTVTLPAEPTK